MPIGEVTTKTTKTRPGEARAWLEHYIAHWHEAEDINACVLWPFSTNGGQGGRYPQIKISVGDRRMVRVTRYVFEQMTGRTLAPSEIIRHVCDEPRCVNPWHFETGDQSDNMRDMVERERSLKGQRNHKARLTEQDVRELRQLIADYGLARGELSFIARGYGVTPAAVHLMLNGKTW